MAGTGGGVATKKKPRFWTKDEDDHLRAAIKKYGTDSYDSWKEVAGNVPNRSYRECMQRWTKVLTPGLKKGKWSAKEDSDLTALVNEQLKSLNNKDTTKKIVWSKISKLFNGRSCKQCRERWINHLDPSVRKGEWTPEEDQQLLRLAAANPNRWAKIARHLNGRTENMVKVRWNALNRQIQKQKMNAAKLKNQMKTEQALYNNQPLSPQHQSMVNAALPDNYGLLNQQQQARRNSVFSIGSLLEAGFNPMSDGSRRGSVQPVTLGQNNGVRKDSFLINPMWQLPEDPNAELDPRFNRERKLSRRLSQIALSLYDPNMTDQFQDTKMQTEEKNTQPRNGQFYLNEIDGNGRRRSSLLLGNLLKNDFTQKVPPQFMHSLPATSPVNAEEEANTGSADASFGRFNQTNFNNINPSVKRRLSSMLYQGLAVDNSGIAPNISGMKRNDYGLFEEDGKRGREQSRRSSLALFQAHAGKKKKSDTYQQTLPTMTESATETDHSNLPLVGLKKVPMRRLSQKLEDMHVVGLNPGASVAVSAQR